MTTLYLVRHAEAEGNAYRRIDGWYNSLITPNGLLQIEALGRRFAEIPIDACYASDRYRTCKTASAVFRKSFRCKPIDGCAKWALDAGRIFRLAISSALSRSGSGSSITIRSIGRWKAASAGRSLHPALKRRCGTLHAPTRARRLPFLRTARSSGPSSSGCFPTARPLIATIPLFPACSMKTARFRLIS